MSAAPESPYILVVEDDPAICEIVELILADEGFEVRSIGTVSAALALVQQRQPDVILLDLTLPGPGGEGFVAAYRRLPDASAPIVVMSGRVDVEQRLATIGADGVLAKPFEVDDLLTMVRAMLARRTMPPDDQSAPDSSPASDDSSPVACCEP